jgi:sporulation protein YlmC with PRC-barrel domain
MLASELAGDSVMTAGGSKLGRLEGVTVDPETGSLEQLHVAPTDPPGTDGTARFEQSDDGTLLVPAAAVEARGDHVLVSVE